MQWVQEQLETLWGQAVEIWGAGGWAMYAIAAIALMMFGLGAHVWLSLQERGFRNVPESQWRRWVTRPREREGPIGDLLDFVTGGRDVKETATYFEQLRTTEFEPFERDLRIMKICVSTAPLMGLLGTVTGMLTTFGALASGSGGDKTMAMIAEGISEALITTETGLVVALPGVFFQYQLGRGFEQYKAFIAHLETVCVQLQYRRELRDRRMELQRTALGRIAERLRAAV
jgi:biopolymer transport protein ExbB